MKLSNSQQYARQLASIIEARLTMSELPEDQREAYSEALDRITDEAKANYIKSRSHQSL